MLCWQTSIGWAGSTKMHGSKSIELGVKTATKLLWTSPFSGLTDIKGVTMLLIVTDIDYQGEFHRSQQKDEIIYLQNQDIT